MATAQVTDIDEPLKMGNEEIIKHLMGIEELTATIQVTRLVELVMEELGLDPENEADLRKGQRVVTIVLVAIKNDLEELPTL